jgi:hypothetical protein
VECYTMGMEVDVNAVRPWLELITICSGPSLDIWCG